MEELNLIRRWWLEWRNRWNSIAGSAILRLGDASGESKLSVRNSDDQEVFYVRSDGRTSVEPGEGADGEALLRGGSRSLLGNLAVAADVTIDGVDISAFKSGVDSWQSTHVQQNTDPHPQYITASTAESTYARSTTSVNGTSGLSGGGALGTGVNTLNLSVNTGYAFAWTAQHLFGEGAKIAASKSLGFADSTGVVDAEIKRASVNTLTLGDGDQFQSTDFSAGSYGYRIDAAGNAEFNNIRARGEFAASTFRVNEVSASAGTLGVFDSASVVWEDFTTPITLNGVGTMKVRNSPAGGALFADGDRLQIKTWDGANVVDAWFIVTAVDNKGAYSECDVTLKSAAANKVIRAGTAVVGWGASGSGAVTLSADGTFGASANLSVMSHAGSPWDTKTLHMRMGNLNGAYGYDTNVYGFAAGDSATNYVSVDGTNGFRVVRSGTTRFQVDASGALTLRNTAGETVISLDSGGSRIDNVLTLGLAGEIRQGKGEIGNALNPFQGLRIWGSTDSGSFYGRIAGYYGGVQQWYSGVDGKLYAGGGDVTLSGNGISVASVPTTRGQSWVPSKAYGFSHEDGGVEQLGLYAQTSSTLTNPILHLINVGQHSPRILIHTEWTGSTGSPEVGVTISAKKGGDFSELTVGPTSVVLSSGLNVGSATGAATGEVKASAGISGTTGTFSGALSATTGTFSGALSATTGTFSGNISATVASNPTLTLKSTAGFGGSRSFVKLESQSNGDYFLFGYFADAFPKRAQWHYNSDGSSSAVPVVSMTSENLVGINKAIPAHALDVDGRIRATTGIFAQGANRDQLTIGSSGNAGAISFIRDSGLEAGWIGFANNSDNEFDFELASGGGYFVWSLNNGTGAVEMMRFNNTNGGSLGIGVVPTSKLHVVGTRSATSGDYVGTLFDITQSAAGGMTVYAYRAIARATHTSGTLTGLQSNSTQAFFTGSGGTTTTGDVLTSNATVTGHTVGSLNMVRVFAPTNNSGTITNLKGILIGNMSAGSTSNYSIYAEGGTQYFAGPTTQVGDLTLSGADIVTDTSVGTRFGTSATQRIGFYGVAAVAQRAGAAQAAVATTGATQTTPWGFTTAAQANAIVTLVNEMRTVLVNLGLMKGAA